MAPPVTGQHQYRIGADIDKWGDELDVILNNVSLAHDEFLFSRAAIVSTTPRRQLILCGQCCTSLWFELVSAFVQQQLCGSHSDEVPLIQKTR